MSTIIPLPPTLDDRTRDITLHGRSGEFLRIDFKMPDGSNRDVSAAALFFEIEGVKREALGAGATAWQRTVTITRADVEVIAAMPDASAKYVLLDESGSVPVALLAAEIHVTGYTGAPV